ncbi:putative glucan 1,3-beta-glucosidase [Rosa chinensis]|uniref:Putative glucan 1,3-beta-glucosidase n=1 Tax=Rosa chinensis TaxID=74649 RepID=A0A2P6PRQ2_ROSCH|nr:putative glucan 1,3-beta-glucosidase [Rosa chinensis]
MTLEEKIGQMTQIERSVASAEVMNKDPELVKKIGAATALEVRATGIAVCRDPK